MLGTDRPEARLPDMRLAAHRRAFRPISGATGTADRRRQASDPTSLRRRTGDLSRVAPRSRSARPFQADILARRAMSSSPAETAAHTRTAAPVVPDARRSERPRPLGPRTERSSDALPADLDPNQHFHPGR